MTGTKVPAVSRNARGARTNSEEFLFTYPDILDVQVIGVPDLKYGEEIPISDCRAARARSELHPVLR